MYDTSTAILEMWDHNLGPSKSFGSTTLLPVCQPLGSLPGARTVAESLAEAPPKAKSPMVPAAQGFGLGQQEHQSMKYL